jgi:hypothetical protein
MWPWIKRWRDWVMHELWFMHRIGLQPQALHYSYEKAGLTLHDQPIPWNAEVVLVEASLRLPPGARRKADFQLRLPGRAPVPAESLRKQDGEDRYHVFFRLSPPPSQTAAAEIHWRTDRLGQLTLPVLQRDEFIQKLRLQLPTLFVRLGDQSVACQTFVATQCRGLLASAVISSPTSLAPLADLGLQLEFRQEKGGTAETETVPLSSSQLAERQALVTIVPRHVPRRIRIGNWVATWRVGDVVLATQRVRAISQRHFQRSLRVSDMRFVALTLKKEVVITRQLPPAAEVHWVRPCFLLSSREAGMAGVCRLEVRAQVPGAVQPPLALEQDALITDGPTWFAPGTEDAASLDQLTGFELRLKGHTLGVLSVSPIPEATFTAEGGFKAPTDFNWSPAADEELSDRLNRLLDKRSGQE